MAVNRAITTLKTVFSGWRASFKTDTEFQAYRREFLLAMIEFRITTETQLERGIARSRHEAAKGREFMPSGAQFAGWCKPDAEELGICDFADAYQRVIRRHWESLHPAFQCIAQETYSIKELVFKDPKGVLPNRFEEVSRPRYDIAAYRQMDERRAMKEFQQFYNEVVRRVTDGEQFERIQAIEQAPPVQSANPIPLRIQRGNDALSKILGMVGGKKVSV